MRLMTEDNICSLGAMIITFDQNLFVFLFILDRHSCLILITLNFRQKIETRIGLDLSFNSHVKAITNSPFYHLKT